MSNMRINYEPLREWQTINRVKGEYLAEVAGIHPSTLSRWINTGEILHGKIMMAWQERFGWTDAERNRYCMNGPLPASELLQITGEEYRKLQALNVFVEALK